MANENNQEEILRVPLPKEGEFIGVVTAKLGGSKFRVFCTDMNERLCRIPGSKKRYMWIDEGSVVIVKPWKDMEEDRGDIIYQYSKAQIDWLKRNKYVDKIKDFLV